MNDMNLPNFVLSSLALFFVSDKEVLSLYLVLHLPVLQKVNPVTITLHISLFTNTTSVKSD